MKRASVCFLLASICLLAAPSAWATWGSFTSTGTATGVGNPSCAPVATKRVVCAVRSGNYTLMVNQFNGTKWGTWQSLPGPVVSDPSCTSDGTGKVICGATASNGNLLVTIFNGTAWSTPAKVPGALYSAPSCAKYTEGQVLCAARNSAGGLAWSLYNGTTWSAFANLTVSTVSAPSCTTDDDNGVICAVFTTGYATLVNRFTAGKWDGFRNIGGIAGGEPDCMSLDLPGEVVCFVKGWGSGIYGSRYNGGAWVPGEWSPWGLGIGGSVNDNASCAAQAAGQVVCGVISINSIFYGNTFNGANWSGWVETVGTGVGTPSCAALGESKVVCTVIGPNNKLTSLVGP
jgi:hypothetical protein